MDYTQLGIKPIDEKNLAGEDIKYDEDFELIQSEISKLISPSASNEIDWGRVSKLSYHILETKSKHLLVAVYLSYSLYKLRGIDGLNDGVLVLSDILENYWENLYPPKKRLKGRVNAIEWWIEKVSKDIENMDNLVVDESQKESLLSNLKKIDDFLNEKLDDAPLFYTLLKLLEMKLDVQKKEAISEASKENISPSTTKTTVVENTSVKEIEGKNLDAQDDFKYLTERLGVLLGQMIEEKDYRAELFISNRAFAWLDIDSLPSSQKNITMIPAPDAQEIEMLSSLYEQKNYEALLFSAESRISSYLFWLDLHYYVAKSLEHLEQIESSNIVYQQMQYFIKKLPNIQKLSFSDSMPFASEATKKWLEVKEIESIQTKAQTKMLKDDIKIDSIDGLSEKMNSCKSIEEQVLYNIKICNYLLENKNETLIYAYTEKLLKTIDIYKTSSWKPEMALEAYGISVKCLKSLDNDEDSKLLNSLLLKIALLKPSLIE